MATIYNDRTFDDPYRERVDVELGGFSRITGSGSGRAVPRKSRRFVAGLRGRKAAATSGPLPTQGGSRAVAFLATPALSAIIDLAALAGASLRTGAPTGVSALWAGLTVLLFAGCGSYRHRLTERVQGEVTAIVTVPVIALAVATVVYRHQYPVLLLSNLLPLGLVLLIAGRAAGYLVLRYAKTRHQLPTAIVGSGQVAGAIARAIEQHPSCGLRVIGLIDGLGGIPRPSSPPLLGDLHDFAAIIDAYQIQRVIVAPTRQRDKVIVELLRTCNLRAVEVYVVPRLFEVGVAGGRARGDELWGFPLVRLSRTATRAPSWRAKRALDVVVSALMLVFLSPLIGLGALLVKLTSPGPVFFKQERIGQSGRTVHVFKLRTMPVLPDSDTRWTVADSTVGRWGRIMRKASIDELPQLWNVLRGDMSLVGPRPERPHFVSKFSQEFEGYQHRHRVPVGLTGWAQVHGLRGDTSIEDRARFDNYYIDNWSVWLDLTIIARTALHVLHTACSRAHLTAAQPSRAEDTAEASVIDLDRIELSVPAPAAHDLSAQILAQEGTQIVLQEES